MVTRKTIEPKPFDIDNPEDIKRLHEELYAYMKISVMDGTDLTGRKYVLEALEKLVEREKEPLPKNLPWDVTRKDKRVCAVCLLQISWTDIKCPHCGRDLLNDYKVK
jgi:hypothetical protein